MSRVVRRRSQPAVERVEETVVARRIVTPNGREEREEKNEEQ